MISTPEIWAAFARIFFMLCVVLAALILLFYFIKRLSKQRGQKGDDLISVIAVHYISPKEKLLLLDVLNEKILIGVTPQSISKLAIIDKDVELTKTPEKKDMKFADFLSGRLMKFKTKTKTETQVINEN